MTRSHTSLIHMSDNPGHVRLVDEASFAALTEEDPGLRDLAILHDFSAQSGRILLRLDASGRREAWFGLGDKPAGALALRALPSRLPPGDWRIAGPAPWAEPDIALAFALGTYSYDAYRSAPPKAVARLLVNEVSAERVGHIAEACARVRDLINTPAADLGPHGLETAALEIAEPFGAQVAVISGAALVDKDYPAVYAVGKGAASDRAPRMIELHWRGADASDSAPMVVLVGKGITFDTGGLDLKPSSAMRWMKKDMGGAAHALGLGSMIMQANLPVRLCILIAAAENAVSADAMRPGDVLRTRKGLTVEVGNTDAEGRLVLADALTRAAELSPDLTLDFATLTGAARVALGPEVVPVYTNDETLAHELATAALAVEDPVWRMPLWSGYEESLESDIADLKNDPDGWAQAGSITAALFLQRFAPTGAWAHFDIFAWNPRKLPGRPFGGEAQAIRAAFSMITARYGETS